MIYRQHGIRNKNISFELKQQSYYHYLDSQIGLGTQIEDPRLENIFINIFSPITNDIFFYSNFSTEENALSFPDAYPNDWFSLEQRPQFGIVIHFKDELLYGNNKEVFSRIKAFLIECNRNNKNQLIALKIIWEDCNELIFKLPKNLTYKTISKIVKCFQSECEDFAHTRVLNHPLIFDCNGECFREE